VELRRIPGTGNLYAELPPHEVRDYRRRLDDLGLGVSFLNTWILKITLPGTEPLMRRDYSGNAWAERARREQERFDRRLEYLRKAIDAAHILGVETIRIFTFWRVQDPSPLYSRIADIILEMAGIAESEKVRLLVENESACNVATSAELAALMQRVPGPAIGINWDPHNGLPYEPQPFPDGYRKLPRHRIGNVQIKGESLLIPGEILAWGAIIRRLLTESYSGRFGLETHFGKGPERIRNAHASMKQILSFAPYA
jgi:sugar phosphate isomerase/epimerase